MKLEHRKTAGYKWQVVLFDEQQRRLWTDFWFSRTIEYDRYIEFAKEVLTKSDIKYSLAFVRRKGPVFKFKRKNDALWFMMNSGNVFNINKLRGSD